MKKNPHSSYCIIQNFKTVACSFYYKTDHRDGCDHAGTSKTYFSVHIILDIIYNFVEATIILFPYELKTYRFNIATVYYCPHRNKIVTTDYSEYNVSQ